MKNIYFILVRVFIVLNGYVIVQTVFIFLFFLINITTKAKQYIVTFKADMGFKENSDPSKFHIREDCQTIFLYKWAEDHHDPLVSLSILKYSEKKASFE